MKFEDSVMILRGREETKKDGVMYFLSKHVKQFTSTIWSM